MLTDNQNTSLPRRPPLRVNNVARRLRRKERTIRHLALKGQLRGFKIDKKSWGFWPEDIDRYERLREERHGW